MRLVMMGTGSFAEPTFQGLLTTSHPVVGLVTQPDQETGSVRSSTRRAVNGMKEIALARGIPVFQPQSINTPEGVAALTEWKPDLLVVAAYGQILSRDVLAVPPQGGINVHASLLPKYRGAAPIAWAIYHGETRTGVTIIRMSTALDAGDMLAQAGIDILPEETAGELELRLAPLGARMAVEMVEKIAGGPVSGEKQDKALVTKAPKLTKEHGLIDWTRTAEEVRNQVRAMQPWPTAYTFLHRTGQPPVRLIITRVQPETCVGTETPGQVVKPEDTSHLRIATGSGSMVGVVELQPAGKRRMSASEFLRGHRLQPGDFFGREGS